MSGRARRELVMTPSEQRNRIIVILVVGLLVSIPFVSWLMKISGGGEERRIKERSAELLQQRGIEVEAEVTYVKRWSERRGKSSVLYQTVNWKFTTKEGRSRTDVVQWVGSVSVGEKVRVRYVPGMTDLSKIVWYARQKADADKRFRGNVFGVVAAVLAFIFFFFLRRKGLRAKRCP